MKAREGRWRGAHTIFLLFYLLLEYPTGASAEDRKACTVSIIRLTLILRYILTCYKRTV